MYLGEHDHGDFCTYLVWLVWDGSHVERCRVFHCVCCLFRALQFSPTLPDDRQQHWLLSPEERSEEIWYLPHCWWFPEPSQLLGTCYAWPMERQLGFCINICCFFGLPFGLYQRFSCWRKIKAFQPLDVLTYSTSVSHKSHNSLLSLLTWIDLSASHMTCTGVLILMVHWHIGVLSNGSDWLSRSLISYFLHILHKARCFDGYVTLSLHFLFSCSYWIPINKFHLLLNFDNEISSNFQVASCL